MSAPATITVEFTGEPVICHNCPTERAKDHLGPEGWRKVRSATTRKLEDVCSRCYTYLKDKSVTSRASTLSKTTPDHSEHRRKLVTNSQRGFGRARVSAISSSLSQSSNPSRGLQGYTPNHSKFTDEIDRHQRKASGTMAMLPPSVTLRVVMARPEVKGARLQTNPFAADLSVNITVLPGIGAGDLLQRCMAAIDTKWFKWSHGHDLPGDVVHIEHKGDHIAGESNCLLEYFAKKPRGGVAVAATARRYDFLVILDIFLVIEDTFYQLVEDHRYQASESGVTKGKHRAQSSHRSTRSSAWETVSAVVPARPHPRKIIPLPTRVRNEASNSIDAVTDNETENPDDCIGSLGRSLSDFQLRNNPPRSSVTSKRPREDTEDRAMTKKPRSKFYVPSAQDLGSAIQSQGSSSQYEATFFATLRVIPTRLWTRGVLEEGVNFLNLHPIGGRLQVDFSDKNSRKGTFKTSHPGSFLRDDGNHSHSAVLPRSLTGPVCVKQFYFTSGGGAGIRRYEGADAQSLIHTEALCLDWAVILLDLTYEFVKDFESAHGKFQGDIPYLCFVDAAVVECQAGAKHFLVEEWIDTSKTTFTKYINNGLPVPSVPCDASVEVRNTADFLCFAQHVQFEVTGGLIYTSDYQGSGLLLTDPQILTNPELGRRLFARGNCEKGVSNFRSHHECNMFCQYFELGPA